MTEHAMSAVSAFVLAILVTACSASGNDASNKPPPSASKAPLAIPPRPGFAKRRALVSQAKAAAGTGDWETCARLFEAAHSWADAARCVVHTTDRERGLVDVQRALVHGWRDLDQLRSDPELAPLQRDPRWRTMIADATTKLADYRSSVNPELEQLVRVNDAVGQPASGGRLDAHVFAALRARVAEIIAAGGVTLADDYVHAAEVYYRADTADDAARAHELALTALERDPDSDDAKWLAAASEDRRLQHEGKPQKYGTQFAITGGRRVLWNVDPSISDAERERWSVPSLAEAIAGDAETAAPPGAGEATFGPL